jgi:hypothetical protein
MAEYLSAEAHIKNSAEISAGDLFDKIINLRFFRKRGEPVTVRSDWEPVFREGGAVSFKRCVQKPSIKVSYEQVSNDVAVEVNIELANLQIVDGDTEGEDNLFSMVRNVDGREVGNPAESCEIYMGYRAQFPDPASVEDYYNLTGGEFYGKKMTVRILASYRKSLPPDSVAYFQGVIGNVEPALRWAHTDGDLKDYWFGEGSFPDGLSEIEAVLFQFVTRRFVRPSVSFSLETQDSGDGSVMQEAVIRDYDKYKDPGLTPIDWYNASLERMSRPVYSAKGKRVKMPKGILSVEDAKKFGVVCIVSQSLREMPANGYFGHGADKKKSGAFENFRHRPFNAAVKMLGGQLAAIRRHYPYVRWYQMMDGSFYFYHAKDKEADLWLDPFVKKMQEERCVILPAIYEMVPQGTRQIKCPFYQIINPMTTVVFQNRFMLGTEASYYYPVETNAFLVIISKVDFSTDGDENMMELTCVDAEKGEVDVDENGHLKIKSAPEKKLPELSKTFLERAQQWAEEKLRAASGRPGFFETYAHWEDNVVKLLKAAKAEDWPEGTKLTEKMALLALREWNPGLFADVYARGNSIENNPTGIGGRTGIPVPIIYPGDEIVVRLPWMPEYPADQEVSVG